MTEGTVVAPASGEQGTSIATSAQWDPLPTALGKAALRRGRFLVVGHSYVLRIHQQKLEALARLCGAIGVLAPSNWRNREGLFDGRPLQFEAASQVLHAYQGRVLRPGHIASHLYDPLALGRALAGLRPDLVQVDQEVYAFSSAQVALAAKAIGAKVAVFGWENLDRPIHPLQRVARRIVFRLADAIVCGNTEGAALVRKWGFQGRIAVVPQLGVDPELFKPRPRRASREFTIGFVGRLVRDKAVDVLFRAAKHLTEREAVFRLHICGAGPCRAELVELTSQLGISDRVTWLSAVNPADVPSVMSEFDALVLPSRAAPGWKEQFGHVLVEAMAMG